MNLQTSRWSPTVAASNYSVRLPPKLPPAPPLNLPNRGEAREQAEVAVALGAGLLIFGLLVLLLLPKP